MSRLFVLSTLACLSLCRFAFAEVTADKTETGVTVKIDGQRFTEYVIKSKSKPILYPIIGPTGKGMTRDWPMKPAAAGEKPDHPHQRSLWFTHGEVNGVDFWAEEGKGKYGAQVHREFVKVSGGKEGLIIARTDWVGPDDKKICSDERTISLGGDSSQRFIDFAITIKAEFGDVTFGDTKEGTFGVRVPDSMRVESKPAGHIVNSAGQTDKDAWAQAAPWVDYVGHVQGETLGIAIFNHPSSFRYPTYWHVRTYGLFAANPFGGKDFKTDKQGAYTVKSGDSIAFRYRVVFHTGDTKSANIAEAWKAYQQGK